MDEKQKFLEFKTFVEQLLLPEWGELGAGERDANRNKIRYSKTKEELRLEIYNLGFEFDLIEKEYEEKKEEKRKDIKQRQQEKRQIIAETEGFLFSEFTTQTNFIENAKRFIEKQPIWYDENKLWWLWNYKEHC